MSGDYRTTVKDDIEPQYTFNVESDVLWVDTICWVFDANFQRKDVSPTIANNNMKDIDFPYNPHMFSLQIEKINPNKLAVELIRTKLTKDKMPDKGYYIQVSFTLVASPCARKVAYMYYDDYKALVYFNLEEFQTLYDPNDTWMIKCVLWMRENSSLDNNLSKEQERMWQNLLKELPHELWLCEKQMATIMGRETLNDLFTGRQDFMFFEMKSTLLIRSFRFSDKLLTDIARLKSQQEPQGSVQDLGRLLGFIGNGQNNCISYGECIRLYGSAYYCGLSYLKLQCSNYLKMILTDVEIFINILIVSDMVNDENLMDFALDWYLKNKEKVLTSAKWQEFKIRNYELSRGFVSLFRKWESDERYRELEDVQRSVCIRY